VGAQGVGLYFDAKRVYLVELRKEFGEIHISRSAEIDVPPPASGMLHEFGPETWEAIRQAFDRTKIQSRSIAIALPEREIMVRYFDMPLLPKKEQTAAIRFESQKYLPFDVRDLYSDYELFPDKRHKRMGVAFLASRKKIVDDVAHNLEQMGVRIAAVETVSVALIRTLPPAAVKTEVQALVSIDRDGALTTVVFRGKSILMSRSSAPRPAPLGVAATAPSEEVVAEIRLAFNYFSKSFKGEPIKRMLVSVDPGEELIGWEELLQREFGLPVSTINAIHTLGRTKTVSPGMAVAIGAALRWVMRDAKVNLLPHTTAKRVESQSLSPEEEKEVLQKWAIRFAIAGLVALVALHFALGAQLDDRKKKLDAARRSPARAATANAGMSPDQLKQREAAINKKLVFLSNVFEKRVLVTSKLVEAARALPEEVRLSSLDYSDPGDREGKSFPTMKLEGMISLSNSGSELALANRFVTALKENEAFTRGFADVKLTAVRKSVPAQDQVAARPGYVSVDCVPVEVRG